MIALQVMCFMPPSVLPRKCISVFCITHSMSQVDTEHNLDGHTLLRVTQTLSAVLPTKSKVTTES